MDEYETHSQPDLSWVRGMIIDMDGVLWRGETILPGVPELFAYLREQDIGFVLATNNATQTPETYRQRMRAAGVEVSEHEVLTSALATAAYLQEQLPVGSALYVVGDDGIRQALQRAEFRIIRRAEEAEAVVAAMSRRVCWEDLAEATLALRRGVPFIGTNPDASFPTERGQVPGAGAILAALEAGSGREPTVIGKPERYLYQQATQILGTEPNDTLILGDRLETDIVGGIRLGAQTALLLTGVTSEEQAADSEIEANYQFHNLVDLMASLGAKETG